MRSTAIEAHAWPGNVRELENVHQARGDHGGRRPASPPRDIGLDGAATDDATTLNLRQVREEAEKHAVLRVLGASTATSCKAAELLGVSRPTLYDLMHRFGLK